MKSLKLFFIAGLLLAILPSCTKVETEKKEELSIGDIFAQLQQEAIRLEEDVQIDFQYLNDHFAWSEIKVSDSKDFLIEFSKGYLAGVKKDNKVTVTCTFEDGTSDSVECNSEDGVCIGGAVSGCLNSGGCASVCRGKLTYVHQIKTLFVDKLDE